MQPRAETRNKRFQIAVLAACCCLALLAFSSLFSWRREPASEVLRAELVQRDGVLYRQGSLVPFSGVMLERYPDGQLLSRSVLRNGKLDGLSEGWHTNGQIQVREAFVDGVSHGTRTRWHLNGNKHSEATIVQGQIEGLFRRWHDSGELAEEVQMKAGVPSGESVAFYPSGYLKARVTLDSGTVVSQRFWQDREYKLAQGSSATQ